MKAVLKLLLLPLALIVLFTQCEKEPGINISDSNFLNALIEQGVDKNGDGNISPLEAEVITSLNVAGYGISDLTGIEAFVKLVNLDCYGNQLTTLDVSHNTALETLWCDYNQLTTLDVSNNTALAGLDCEGNHLTNLDVSNNTALVGLGCVGNQLTNLDVSKNPKLIALWCSRTQLTTLDVSHNTALTELLCTSNQLTTMDISNNSALHTLWITGMPTLLEVCVWTLPFPPEGVTVDATGSPNVYFTTECSK